MKRAYHVEPGALGAGNRNAYRRRRDVRLAGRWQVILRTRLNPFTEAEQCRLINGGYALCDAAMRKSVLPPGAPAPAPQWPYLNFSLDMPIAQTEITAASAAGFQAP